MRRLATAVTPSFIHTDSLAGPSHCRRPKEADYPSAPGYSVGTLAYLHWLNVYHLDMVQYHLT
jgi:hypothetical protein